MSGSTVIGSADVKQEIKEVIIPSEPIESTTAHVEEEDVNLFDVPVDPFPLTSLPSTNPDEDALPKSNQYYDDLRVKYSNESEKLANIRKELQLLNELKDKTIKSIENQTVEQDALNRKLEGFKGLGKEVLTSFDDVKDDRRLLHKRDELLFNSGNSFLKLHLYRLADDYHKGLNESFIVYTSNVLKSQMDQFQSKFKSLHDNLDELTNKVDQLYRDEKIELDEIQERVRNQKLYDQVALKEQPKKEQDKEYIVIDSDDEDEEKKTMSNDNTGSKIPITSTNNQELPIKEEPHSDDPWKTFNKNHKIGRVQIRADRRAKRDRHDEARKEGLTDISDDDPWDDELDGVFSDDSNQGQDGDIEIVQNLNSTNSDDTDKPVQLSWDSDFIIVGTDNDDKSNSSSNTINQNTSVVVPTKESRVSPSVSAAPNRHSASISPTSTPVPSTQAVPPVTRVAPTNTTRPINHALQNTQVPFKSTTFDRSTSSSYIPSTSYVPTTSNSSSHVSPNSSNRPVTSQHPQRSKSYDSGSKLNSPNDGRPLSKGSDSYSRQKSREFQSKPYPSQPFSNKERTKEPPRSHTQGSPSTWIPPDSRLWQNPRGDVYVPNSNPKIRSNSLPKPSQPPSSSSNSTTNQPTPTINTNTTLKHKQDIIPEDPRLKMRKVSKGSK